MAAEQRLTWDYSGHEEPSGLPFSYGKPRARIVTVANNRKGEKGAPRITVWQADIPGKIISQKVAGFDKIEITGHALKQMRIRGISEAMVLQALRRPTRRGLRTQPGRKRVRKNRGTYKAVDVVYRRLQ